MGKGGSIMRKAFLAAALGALTGCATLVHGPSQDVLIDSNPPGAKATVSGMLSERGPNFIDKQKQEVTTPATVRLRRDNSYRVELQQEGYKIATNQVVSEYDWFMSPLMCGACEAIGALPTYDMSERSLPVRFAQAAFYEYPVGTFRAIGRALRLISPEAIMGTSFKLKAKDAGYWDDWTGVGTPRVSTTLEPIS
jgi:hypothetical protein